MGYNLSYAWSRRRFLQGIGAAVGLATVLRGLERAAEGAPGPKRFLMIQRPVGTVHENFWPEGEGTSFALSRILQPFGALRDRMVVLRDLKLPYDGSLGGGHESGTVLMTTGQRVVRLNPDSQSGGDDALAAGPSIDQILVSRSEELKGTIFPSLQVSCDNRADTPAEVSTRNISYAGPEQPMTPYYQPQAVYERLFSSMMPGGGDTQALAQARKEKKSVLDFAMRDLKRLEGLAPSSQRVTLDAHIEAIRQLEREFDANPLDPVSCGVGEKPEIIDVADHADPYGNGQTTDVRDDEKHARLGALHLAVIKAAFRCDLTRVAAFQWSPGTNHVSFGGMWPTNPDLNKIHHTVSHEPDGPDMLEFLTRVEVFYAEKLAAFLSDLATTEDLAGGSLLDNTLVPYITEVAKRNHTMDDMPWLLFGGANTKLVGGQVWTNDGGGLRSTNDMWMACAAALGVPDLALGDSDQHTTAIHGLFA